MAVIEVTNANFENEVINSKLPVLADFYANWCGPCRMLRPMLEELADDRTDVKVVSINVDEEGDLAAQYQISSIPCVVYFKNGAEADRSVGLVPRDAIESMIR